MEMFLTNAACSMWQIWEDESTGHPHLWYGFKFGLLLPRVLVADWWLLLTTCFARVIAE